jgi:cell division transport system permease protein
MREGMKNIFRNGWMTFASVAAVTVTLILVGAFLALMLNLNQMANKIEEDVQIDVLIDPTSDEASIKTLGEKIQNIEKVDKAIFSSKDEELDKLIKGLGEEGQSWKLYEQDNPLNHVFIVQTKRPADTVDVATAIEGFEDVEQVIYGKDVVKRLFTFNTYARNIGLVLIVGLVFTAIFLISNTIKLTIMARSKEIGIQKLVGATNGFIRWPFFIEGMMLGILGSVIPITLILTGYYYLENNVRDKITYSFVDILPFHPFAWQLSIVVLLIGTVIGMWGSVMSVRKFLKV